MLGIPEGDETMVKAKEKESYFPIVILLNNEYFLIQSPESLPVGLAFTVIATRIQDGRKEHQKGLLYEGS